MSDSFSYGIKIVVWNIKFDKNAAVPFPEDQKQKSFPGRMIGKAHIYADPGSGFCGFMISSVESLVIFDRWSM